MPVTMIEIDCAKIAARVDEGFGPYTVALGRRQGPFELASGPTLQIRPFAASERLMGNRAMTTTVIIHPHPAPGLKVQIDLVSPIDGGVNSTEFLKAGDPTKTVYAHDGLSVHVSEVKDEPMVEVEGDELPGEQIFDPST